MSADAGRRLYWAIQRRRNDGLGALFIVLAAFCVLYAVLFPGILAVSTMNKFVQGWLPSALVAAAETIVMLTGGIDLAVGPMVSLGSVVAATTMQGPLGIFGGVLAVLALGAGVGTLVGWFVAVARYPAIIVTLAMSFVLRGVALLILPRPGGVAPPLLSDALAGERPTAALLLVLLIVGWKIYQATPLGVGLIAVGDNAEGAYRSGVDVVTSRMSAYAMSGVLQALTGLYVAAQTGSGDPLIGEPLTLSAIAAAVLGGVGFLGGQGTMRGALAGSLLMSILIGVMFFMDLPQVAQYVVQGLIIVDRGVATHSRFPTESGVMRLHWLRDFLTSYGRSLVAFVVVAAIWIGASIFIRGFGAFGHLRYIVELASVIGLVAVGQTLAVIGGGIDLSVSAVITVAAILVPLLTFGGDTSGLGAIGLTLLVATSIGAVNGLGIGYLGLPPLIMTLAMATILQGVLVLIAGGSAISVDNPTLTWLGESHVMGVSASILLWLIVAVAALFWLHFTRSGALIFAIGTNPLVSQLSGIPIQRLTLMLYAVAGLCAGLAGMVLLSMNGQGYVGIGDPYLLSSIAAVVLGGTSILGGRGTYLGTIAGAVLLVTMTALITVINASEGWRSIILGCLILGLLPLSGRDRSR